MNDWAALRDDLGARGVVRQDGDDWLGLVWRARFPARVARVELVGAPHAIVVARLCLAAQLTPAEASDENAEGTAIGALILVGDAWAYRHAVPLAAGPSLVARVLDHLSERVEQAAGRRHRPSCCPEVFAAFAD